MKATYPIILTQGEKYIVADIPDFHIGTQGRDRAEAMEMARDAIGLMGIDMEDDGEALPEATDMAVLAAENPQACVTLVDVDFTEYRRQNDLRAVRKNCTIPAWLSYQAEKAGLNFSALLQEAIKAKLHITE